jgi:hypothetical protein
MNQFFGAPNSNAFMDRRSDSQSGGYRGSERRQFSNSHTELSPAAAELGNAVDRYKLTNRRRFITYEELLGVIKSLGYEQAAPCETVQH